MSDALWLSLKKNTDVLIEKSKTKPQDKVEIKMNCLRQTLFFDTEFGKR